MAHSILNGRFISASIIRRMSVFTVACLMAQPIWAEEAGSLASTDSVTSFYGLTDIENWGEPEPEATISDQPAATSIQQGTDQQGTDLETIRERFPNGRVNIEREVTVDSEGNYVNHGAWRMWDKAGKAIAEGQYNMGRRVGLWTRWYGRDGSPLLREYPFNRFQTPFVSQATFTEGQLDGDWVVFDKNQQKCSLITFQNGKRDGTVIIWLPGGQVYREATYRQGTPVGDVLQRNRNNKLDTVASYLDGHQIITKVSHFPGKSKKVKKSEATYLAPETVVKNGDDFWLLRFAEYEAAGEDQRHGAWKTWYPSGQLQLEGSYQQDRETGTFTWWHSNGQKAVQGDFANGQQSGPWVWWHSNGQKSTVGEYLLGSQTGKWRRWTPEGRMEQQTYYNDGQVDLTPEQSRPELELGRSLPILSEGPSILR